MNQVLIAGESGHCPNEAGMGRGNPMRLTVDIP